MILVFAFYLSFTSFILPPAFCWAGLIANDFFAYRSPLEYVLLLFLLSYFKINHKLGD